MCHLLRRRPKIQNRQISESHPRRCQQTENNNYVNGFHGSSDKCSTTHPSLLHACRYLLRPRIYPSISRLIFASRNSFFIRSVSLSSRSSSRCWRRYCMFFVWMMRDSLSSEAGFITLRTRRPGTSYYSRRRLSSEYVSVGRRG